MTGSRTTEKSPHAQRGLWRLMLKLPALRGSLQILAQKSSALENLCEAYEDACTTLDRLRKRHGTSRDPLIEEYETICGEIESDVIQLCLHNSS